MQQGQMKIGEALEIATQLENHFRAFARIKEVLQLVSSLEGETSRVKKEYGEWERKLTELKTRVDEKHTELQAVIDSMTETAEAQAKKSQEMLTKLKNHCDEQMISVREKYVTDKARISKEIGDLEAQRNQLIKAIQKLRTQEQQVKDSMESKKLLQAVGYENGHTPQQESLDRIQKARKEEMERTIAKFKDDKEVLTKQIGDLQGQRSQLQKAIESLRDQQAKMKAAPAADISAPVPAEPINGTTPQIEAFNKVQADRKAALQKEIEKFKEERERLVSDNMTLRGEHAQLTQQIKKLREQQVVLHERAVGDSA